MQIDYPSLYQNNSLGHVSGAKPLSDDVPSVVESLIAQLNCQSLLDVGCGSGELLRTLRDHGIDCIGADLRPNPEMGIAQFDLSIPKSPEDIQSVLGKLPNLSSPGLLTCFDTLQHLSRAHLSRALWNLRDLCHEWFLASVNTCPSVEYNANHTTLLPKSTWLLLFEALGFSLEEHPSIDRLNIPLNDPDGPSSWCINHWRHLNPYRDSRVCESQYLLLRKREEPTLSFEAFERKVSRILGVISHTEKPSIDSEVFISFLLGHYQGFLILEPFFDLLPKDSFRVLMRSGPFDAIEPHRRRSLISYFDARGITSEQIESVGDLKWVTPTQRPNHAFVTAIDSTAAYSHLVNSALVVEAQKNGVPTFQLQHGIWPHAEFPGGLTVLADYLLTWSPDFERPFLLETEPQRNDETSSKHKELAQARHTVLNVGSPRFGTYYGCEAATIVELFGDWTSKYTSSVLVATNLHWPLHARGSAVLPQLARTAAELPETLFICKLHPAHDYDPTAFSSMPENVLVVDEFVSLYADLGVPRLINACDAVVCTQSTVALEAAIARKPLSVLDTGNPNRYEGIVLSEIEQMTNSVRHMLRTAETEHQGFLQVYYNAADQSNSMSNVLQAISDSFRTNRPQTSASDIATASFAHSFLLEIERRNRAEIECARLSSELQSLRPPPPSSQVIHQPVALQVSEQTEETVKQADSQNDSAEIRLGKITNRDQLPQLLNALGLKGIGVELGVASGEYSNQLLELSELRLLFSVDRWSDHHNDAECQHACSVLSKHRTRSSVLRMTFHEALQHFPDESFEFIYLDGYAHTGQDGINTLDAWWKKLKPGGMFSGHDYHPTWPATIAVVDQFIAKHELSLYATSEDPSVVEHAYPTWYTIKPLQSGIAQGAAAV